MAATANDDGGGAGATMTAFFPGPSAGPPNIPVAVAAGVRLSPLRNDITRMMCTAFFLPVPMPKRLPLMLLLVVVLLLEFLSVLPAGVTADQGEKRAWMHRVFYH